MQTDGDGRRRRKKVSTKFTAGRRGALDLVLANWMKFMKLDVGMVEGFGFQFTLSTLIRIFKHVLNLIYIFKQNNLTHEHKIKYRKTHHSNSKFTTAYLHAFDSRLLLFTSTRLYILNCERVYN